MVMQITLTQTGLTNVHAIQVPVSTDLFVEISTSVSLFVMTDSMVWLVTISTNVLLIHVIAMARGTIPLAHICHDGYDGDGSNCTNIDEWEFSLAASTEIVQIQTVHFHVTTCHSRHASITLLFRISYKVTVGPATDVGAVRLAGPGSKPGNIVNRHILRLISGRLEEAFPHAKLLILMAS